MANLSCNELKLRGKVKELKEILLDLNIPDVYDVDGLKLEINNSINAVSTKETEFNTDTIMETEISFNCKNSGKIDYFVQLSKQYPDVSFIIVYENDVIYGKVTLKAGNEIFAFNTSNLIDFRILQGDVSLTSESISDYIETEMEYIFDEETSEEATDIVLNAFENVNYSIENLSDIVEELWENRNN